MPEAGPATTHGATKILQEETRVLDVEADYLKPPTFLGTLR